MACEIWNNLPQRKFWLCLFLALFFSYYRKLLKLGAMGPHSCLFLTSVLLASCHDIVGWVCMEEDRHFRETLPMPR